MPDLMMHRRTLIKSLVLLPGVPLIKIPPARCPYMYSTHDHMYFVDCDYAQIEFRLIAQMDKISRQMAFYKLGIDMEVLSTWEEEIK